MKIVVIGSGGREHAIGWKLAQDGRGDDLYFLRGNGGTCEIGSNVAISATDIDGVARFAKETDPDLIVIGPEDPLALGMADRLAGEGFTVFGPTAEGARIESSKVFAKELMSRYSIPTAPFKVFTSASAAHAYIDHVDRPVVVKADGLAKGKGSIVTRDKASAHLAVESMMVERVFGEAGDTVVIEDKLTGEEASVLAVTDGERYVVLPPSQDHKPVYDGDEGPNTGGMGAYCPAPIIDRATLDRIESVILRRLLKALAREGCRYGGVIYAGLMLKGESLSVIEFNARFGDPETQCILPAIDEDFGDLLVSAARGRLARSRRIDAGRWAVSVVMASRGYPGPYEKGKVISGTGQAGVADDVIIFHAGTERLGDGSLLTAGGRVLAVTGIGKTLREARRKAYNAGRKVGFDGSHMRTDIGLKGLKRLEKSGVI